VSRRASSDRLRMSGGDDPSTYKANRYCDELLIGHVGVAVFVRRGRTPFAPTTDGSRLHGMALVTYAGYQQLYRAGLRLWGESEARTEEDH
jgi:hypothetical protein